MSVKRMPRWMFRVEPSEKLKLEAAMRVIESCLYLHTRQATIYLTPKLIVRGVRRFRFEKRQRRDEMIVTVGEPNFKERKFIALCKKTGERFPVRKIQWEWFKKRRS